MSIFMLMQDKHDHYQEHENKHEHDHEHENEQEHKIQPKSTYLKIIFFKSDIAMPNTGSVQYWNRFK
jgi:ABC-type Zn2+ transport system substrate-binding protein/surface adhesin